MSHDLVFDSRALYNKVEFRRNRWTGQSTGVSSSQDLPQPRWTNSNTLPR